MVENKTFKFCLGLFCSIGGVIIVLILLNSILRGDRIDPNKTYGPSHNFEVPVIDDDCDTHLFVPTANDIMVLDTIEQQVGDIEKDIDTLHIRIGRIEDKIDALIIEQDND